MPSVRLRARPACACCVRASDTCAALAAAFTTASTASSTASSPLQPRNAFRGQYLLLEEELVEAGFVSGINVTALAIRADSPVGSTVGRLVVQLASTDLSSLEFTSVSSGFTTVTEASVVPAAGWITLSFATPWPYAGGAVVVQLCVAEASGA